MLNLKAHLTSFLLVKVALAADQINVTNGLGEYHIRPTEPPLNISGEGRAPSARARPVNDRVFSCDGSKYGDDLVQSSCLEALQYISIDPTMRSFRSRTADQAGNLPVRMISSKYRTGVRRVNHVLK